MMREDLNRLLKQGHYIYTCICCFYLSQTEGASVIFEFVLYSPQLSEFRDIRERLQPSDCFL